MAKHVTYEEFFDSLPKHRQRKIKARAAELIAEYEALIAADRAAGKIPPEDLPIDESIFSEGSIPRREERLTRLEAALDYFPPKRRKEVEPLARRYLAKYDELKTRHIIPDYVAEDAVIEAVANGRPTLWQRAGAFLSNCLESVAWRWRCLGLRH